MPADEPAPSHTPPLPVLPIILVGIAIAYATTLTAWFVHDDFWFLWAGERDSVGTYVATVFDPRDIGSAYELNRYRPLYPLLWRAQYELFGMDAAWYHASVIAAHLACVGVVALIFRRLLSPTGASFATVIFALHPIYADAIAWVSGANRVYAALPFFAAILCFMRAQDAPPPRARALWLTSSFILHAVAILTHPSSVGFLGLATLYVVLFTPGALRSPRTYLHLVPFVVVAVATFAVQRYVRDLAPAGDAFSFGFHQYSTFGWYVGASVVPLDHYGPFQQHPDIVRAAQFVASVVVLSGVAGLVATRRLPRAGVFAFGWFVIALAPDSTLVISQFGRALYVAGPAIAIVAVVVVQQALAATPSLRRTLSPHSAAPTAALLALALTLSVACAARTRGLIDQSHESEHFAYLLRTSQLKAQPGDTLLVLNAPASLTAFGASWIDSIAQLYYPGVTVQLGRGDGAAAPPGTLVFVYRDD